jgi:phage tail-like protein
LAAPRRSSLRYLPAPFHQDPESRHFLDRLLAYFDSVLWQPTAIGRSFPAYLDAEAAPVGAFLDWLGSWFDWEFLAAWPEATRREMIAEAIPYFRTRGTAKGLRRLLQWHTGIADPYPVVLEHFRLRDRPPAPPLHIGGFPLAPGASEFAHVFTLVLPAAAVTDRTQVEALIEAQKPAHTHCELRLIEPGFRVGRQSSLAVDSLVGGVPMLPLGLGHLAQSIVTASAGPPRIGRAILAHPGGCS